MKINEVDPRNYDSDIDYYDALRRSGRKPQRDPDDYEQPEPYDAEDAISQQRQAAAAKARAQRKTTWDDKQEGSAPNGKQYNSRYIIDAPNKASADGEAYSFKDHHWGAKNVVDTEYKDLGDGRVELTMYVVDNHKYGMWKPWRDQPAQESAEQGVAEGSDDLRSAVLSVIRDIYNGAQAGEDMIDNVADELGDYFNDVKRSKDQTLRKAYQLMRQQGVEAEGDPEMMAQIAKQAIDMLSQQGVEEGVFGIDSKTKGAIQNVVSQLSDIPGMWDHQGQTFTPQGLEQLHALLKNNKQHIEYAVNLTADDFDESVEEKAKNPYAIGMAQAMKSTGDKPPLDKATIRKAHEIAKRIMQKD